MKKLILCLGLAVSLAACGGDDRSAATSAAEKRGLVEKAVVKTSTPEAALESMVANLKGNNIMGLMKTMMPADALDKARAEYIKERDEAEITDAERAQFDQTIVKLTSDGAEDAMLAELEPQLATMGAQLPMMMAFGQMAVAAAIQENADLSPEQKSQATESMNATFKAIQDADVTNPELLREAVGKLCDTARSMELTTLDEFRALSFDDAMGKVGIALGGAKEVLGVYGLSVDSMFDSMQTETISTDGDAAKVKVSYEIFGSPQSSEVTMTKIDGEWYVKDLIDEINDPDNDLDVDFNG